MSDPLLEKLFTDHDATAVVDGGLQFSYAEIQQHAIAVANKLHELGLQPGDRVAALMANSHEAIVAFLGTAHAGCGFLPLNIGFTDIELASYFKRCEIKAVMTNGELRSRIPRAGPKVGLIDEIIGGAMAAVTAAGDDDSMKLDPQREFVHLSTSGSTGQPRIVTRTARAIFENARNVGQALKVTAQDTFLSVVPFWHANGFSTCLLLPLFNGARILVMDRFLPREMLELIDREKPSVVIGSPFIFRALAKAAPSGQDFSYVRAWISSGAAIPPNIDEQLVAMNILVRQLYGSTQTGTISISNQSARNEGSVGRPLDGVQVRIVDDDGRELASGERGGIQIKSLALFAGYLGENAGNGDFFTRDGFYKMGDLGRIDAAGDICLYGRSDSLINVSGVKVDPLEVQNVLLSMPEIEQSLVFRAHDNNGMEIVKALLVTNSEIGIDNVLRYCRTRLAEFKLPRIIEFVEEIPQDMMGKTTRNALGN